MPLLNRDLPTIPVRRLTATAVLVTTAALALGACSSGPGSSPSAPASASASAPASAPASSPAPSAPSSSAASSSAASSSSSPSASAGSTTPVGSSALLAAGATARSATAATVVSIESERGGAAWEVHVVGNDGSEQQLTTSADGTKVTAGPTAERPDADDRAENARYAAVDVDYRRAAAAITKAVANGSITELNLDTAGSRLVWEADVTAGSEKRSVTVDASSGVVTSNTVGR